MDKVYIEFRNDGEIDVNAFRLLGASSKENDDSKIGFFGSGLKYAMAVLLRNNIEFKIFSGTKEIKVGLRKTSMRGDEYEVITINKSPTSMTTRMGKDWKVWYAIREVYSNCLDELNGKVGINNEAIGKTGETVIYIEMNEEIKAIWDNKEKYFSMFRKHSYEFEGNKVFEPLDRKNLIVYRKGILVYEQKVEDVCFDYDLKELAINESRVISSHYELHNKMVNFLRSSTDIRLVSRMIEAINIGTCFEKDLEWNYGYGFSETWIEAIDNRKIIPIEYSGMFIDDLSGKHIKLPWKLCKELKEAFGDRICIRGIDGRQNFMLIKEADNKQKALISSCVDFLNKAGLKIDMEIVVAQLDPNIHGTVHDNKIVLAENVFIHGKKEIVSTIIEEYSHIKSGHTDRTRAFQDFLISNYISMLEEKVGDYL